MWPPYCRSIGQRHSRNGLSKGSCQALRRIRGGNFLADGIVRGGSSAARRDRRHVVTCNI